MVPNDPYIDPGEEEEGGEEGNGDEIREGNSGFNQPGYPGNPTQPQMAQPLSGQRYISIASHRNGVTSKIVCTGGVMGTGGVGWDLAVNLIDVTGDAWDSSASTTNFNTASGSMLELNYGFNLNITTNPNGSSIRQIDVHFASTHVERMEVVMPGESQSFYDAFLGATTFAFGGGNDDQDVFECSIGSISNPHGKWYDQFTFWANGLNNLPYYKATYVNGIDDPSGIFTDYASVGASTMSNSANLPTRGSYDFNTGSSYRQIATDTFTSWVPDVTQASVQKWEILMDFNLQNFQLPNPNFYNTINTEVTNGTYNTSFASTVSAHLNDSLYANTFFVHIAFYTENLNFSCGPVLYTIDGCNDPNNMAYWYYTGVDCNSVAIPSNIQLNPGLATWNGICCPDCINPLSVSDPINYSTDPLILNVQATDPTTIGGSDGYIDVTIVDQGFDATGVPLGLPTGVANYTYVLKNQNPLDDMLSQTAGKAVSSGAVTKTSWTFGYLVSGANVNGGLLQTGATGTTAITTSAAQGYVPGGSDIGTTAIAEGLKDGCYDVYVFDSATDPSVCLGQAQICINDPAPTIGCTDSNALNYDVLANVSNNSTCHYCDDSTGELVDGNGTIVSSISQTSGNVIDVTTHPTHTTATNTEFDITNLSPTAQFQAYVNDVVSGSTSTQNAEYMVSVHKWTVQTTSGSYAASSIVGSAINNGNNGWTVNNVKTSSLGGGITYGYYSLKIWISDPDANVEIEECYEIIDFIIPVPVCLEGGVATASDGDIVSDANLYFHDQAICDILNNFCCDTPLFQHHASSTDCDPRYESEISCDPQADSLKYTIQKLVTGNWVTCSVTYTVTPSSSTYNTGILDTNIFDTYGDGSYRVEWESEYSNSDNCIVYSNTVVVTFGIWGCMDSSLDGQGNQAINYNSLATCAGPCEWCIYGCTDQTATNYNALATCDDGTCIYCVYGCMDITASNYNSLATCDDGDCLVEPCGCTDETAINYDPTANCDDGSCYYCEDPPMTYTYTTTEATTSVIASGAGGFYCQSNSDGCIHLTVSSTTCITGQWELVTCTTYCGISQSYVNWLTPGTYYWDRQVDFCDLPAGCYTFTILDCNECEMIFDICIPTEGTDCGCTDPAALNYNPAAIYDDGSCEYCGCTDENAINYNPQATQNCDPDTCKYPSLTPPCIPASIQQTIRRLETCIAENGFDYYNKLVAGKSDDCSIMNIWKLILMTYLLKKMGLDCIYNCADANTPDASEVYKSCDDLWITGGPSTGLNDATVNTLTPAVGTTSTVTLFTSGVLTPGDVIKHHISENIWIFYGPGQNGIPTPVSVAGLDPENASGNLSGYWGYCNDSMRYISNEHNINYIDNFINFANTFCRDCGNDPKGLSGGASNIVISSTNIVHGIDGIDEIDGIKI